MLILTRRIQEVIVINENIKIMVLGIRGNQVKIGIEADKDIPIHRLEIFEKIQQLAQELETQKE
jgi:carbon storage regulator